MLPDRREGMGPGRNLVPHMFSALSRKTRAKGKRRGWKLGRGPSQEGEPTATVK